MGTLTWYKGIILGLIQGATEFFPVSSSAHLVIAQSWMGIRESARVLAGFDLFLHAGTLVAAVIFFRWDLAWLFGIWVKPWRAGLRRRNPPSAVQEPQVRRLCGLLLLGILPVGIVGYFFHSFFEDLFNDTMVVALFLLITGSILNATRKAANTRIPLAGLGLKQALLVGLAQIFAVLPGISRSGVTIAAGLFARLTPEAAFRFSFLMMIPIVGGGLALKLPHLVHLRPDLVLAAVLGGVMAGVTGYFCIQLMLRWMQEGKFANFSYYCWSVGTVVLLKEMFL